MCPVLTPRDLTPLSILFLFILLGRRFPSDAVPPALIDPWFAEGGLIGTTAARIGDAATIRALTAHRETYITEHDFVRMAAAGIKYVRLAVGWWVFASDPSTITSPSIIPDLCYPATKRFVTVWLLNP